MAVFVEARTEPFEGARNEMAQGIREGGRSEYPVRRPLRGYQAKQDTYAVIRVMGPDGKFLPVIDAAGDIYSEEIGGQTTTFYSNFFIQSVTEERHEKQQIVDTFGDSYIFFFGEAPRMWSVNGFLLNTADFNWRAEFWDNYERYFRGTRLVELGARLYLIYDDIIVEGYMLGANVQENAAPTPGVLPFQFQMFLTGYTNVSAIGDPDFPKPDGAIDYAQLSAFDQAIQNWQRNRNLQRELTEDAVRRANQRQYQIGSFKSLADSIRGSIITGNPPSISGMVSRAFNAVKGFLDFEFGAVPSRPERKTALRTKLNENWDEFINLPELSARELAANLSMADRWLEMDRGVDKGIGGLTIGFSLSAPGFTDVMGRMGRAESQIRITGRGGLGSGSTGAGPSRPGAMFSRNTPFGMTKSSATLL